jgi:hypothetical protein
MRSTALLALSSVAEGSSLISEADFGRFVEIAAGSPVEVLSESRIAR